MPIRTKSRFTKTVEISTVGVKHIGLWREKLTQKMMSKIDDACSERFSGFSKPHFYIECHDFYNKDPRSYGCSGENAFIVKGIVENSAFQERLPDLKDLLHDLLSSEKEVAHILLYCNHGRH